MSSVGRGVMFALLALVITGAFAVVALPAGRDALASGVAWLRASGGAGQALAVAVVVLGIPLGIPTLWFAALLGYVYGVSAGLPTALAAIFTGTMLAFAAARRLFRAEVERIIARRPRWRAIGDAVAHGGVHMVLLLRIAGPHNMLNLALAASPLTPRRFALGTFLGSIPSITLATIGGALAPDAAALWQAREDVGPAHAALLAAGALALLVAGLLLLRATRRALARAGFSRATERSGI